MAVDGSVRAVSGRSRRRPHTWRCGLFSKRYEELWRQRQRHAFPHGSVVRKDLTERMRLLQRFRNRVAHHDCLLRQNIGERSEDMLLIAGWIDPDAAAWLHERSRVHALLTTKP